MRYAPFLPRHGAIGFAAPSFGCASSPYREAFESAQKNFRRLGYRLDPGPNCYAAEGIGISNTPQKCAAELMEWYQRKENDCLISCGGGELMCEILEYLDFDVLKKADPKWYMGYSDNTNFTFLQATLCDTAAIYGPCAPAFGMRPWHPSLKDAMGLLTGRKTSVSGYPFWEKESLKDEDHPLAPYHVTEPRILRVFPDGKTRLPEKPCSDTAAVPSDERRFGETPHAANAPDRELRFSGRLLGGCMDCLVNLTGTRFDRVGDFVKKYRDDGILWFLESCDLNVFGIRRAMWQMEQAGWFEGASGFLIGRPLCFGQEMMGLDAYEAVLSIARRRGVPVVMDADLGHLPPMMPLITGSLGHVRVKGSDIHIRMEQR